MSKKPTNKGGFVARRPWQSARYQPADLLPILLIAAVYFLTAKFGLSLAYGTAQATTVWPPAGIALAVTLRLGFKYWPGILLGAFFANVTTNAAPLIAACIAVGNTLEALAGAAWLRRANFHHSFGRIRDVWIFIGIALAVVFISALVGVTSLAAGREIAWADFRSTLRVWYLGDLMGILIVAPVILLWQKQRLANLFHKSQRGTYALFGTVFLSQLLTYIRSYQATELLTPRSYQAFPLVIWAAIKTSPFGVALSTLIIAMIAVIGTTRGLGPFTQQSSIESNLISLQSFLFYVVATGMTLAAIVAERNVVTKNLQVEKKELSESKARVEGMVLSIGEGLVVVDAAGKIMLVNPIFERLTGWLRREVIGHQIQDILPLESADRRPIPSAERLVTKVLQRGRTIVTGLSPEPHYYVRRDGQRFPVAVSVAPIRVGGKIIGAVNVFRDISEEFAVDRAKNEFVALASHQLRTPLSAIRWYTEMLTNQEVGPVNDKQRQYLDQIYRGNLRMVDLVNALLNVSRIELGKLSVEPRPTSLVDLTESVLIDFQADIQEHRLRIVRQYDKSIPLLSVDPQLIRMVIQNILSNAVKYTPSQGTVTVSIGWQPTRGARAKATASKNVLITVQDTGYGIPASQQNKIFTKLFRADNVRKQETTGTGLGLYIAKAIVEQSGGQISFTSVEGKGSTFSVVLPVSGMKKQTGTRTLSLSKIN